MVGTLVRSSRWLVLASFFDTSLKLATPGNFFSQCSMFFVIWHTTCHGLTKLAMEMRSELVGTYRNRIQAVIKRKDMLSTTEENDGL